MGRCAIDNRTRWPITLTFPHDTKGRPRIAVVVDTRWCWQGHTVAPTEEQRALPIQEHAGIYEKQGTDVGLRGTAHPPSGSATSCDVTLAVGPLTKTVRVFGERRWAERQGRPYIAPPTACQKVSLSWENAFGGWDRHGDAAAGRCEARNPVGRGYRRRDTPFEEGTLLPQLEDPNDLLTEWGQQPAPACFDFVPTTWEPRRMLAGTFDETWQRERMPALPADFDLRFFSAAAPGLIATPHLHGGEPVALQHVHAETPEQTFSLPRLSLQASVCSDRGEASRDELTLSLDTVLFDADICEFTMTYRASVPLLSGALDVRGVRLREGTR